MVARSTKSSKRPLVTRAVSTITWRNELSGSTTPDYGAFGRERASRIPIATSSPLRMAWGRGGQPGM